MPGDPTLPRATVPRETTPGDRPPRAPEDSEWRAHATPFAAAQFLAAASCHTAGLDDAATAVIAASFLAASAPMAALRATALRVIAMAAGAALGVAGALWGPCGRGRRAAGRPPRPRGPPWACSRRAARS